MTPYEFLVYLLRHEASGRLPIQATAPSGDECFWREFLSIIRREGLEFFAYQELKESNWERYIPQFATDTLATRSLISTCQVIRKLGVVQDLHKLFSDQLIPCVWLKGAALAESFYLRPGDRVFNDLDLLVLDEDVGKVSQILLTAGYVMDPCRSRWSMELNHIVHHHLPPLRKGDIAVEVHFKLMHNDKSMLGRDLIMSRIPGKGLPHPQLHALFLCGHLVKHAQAGQPYLRLLRDLRLVVGLDPKSWGTLENLACHYGWNSYVTTCEKWVDRLYGSSPPQVSSKDTSTVAGRNPDGLWKRFREMPGLRVKIIWLADLLFPSDPYLKMYHPAWSGWKRVFWIFRCLTKGMKRLILRRDQ